MSRVRVTWTVRRSAAAWMAAVSKWRRSAKAGTAGGVAVEEAAEAESFVGGVDAGDGRGGVAGEEVADGGLAKGDEQEAEGVGEEVGDGSVAEGGDEGGVEGEGLLVGGVERCGGGVERGAWGRVGVGRRGACGGR